MSENNWDTIKVSDLVTVLTDYVSNGSFASLAENVEYQQSGYARLIRLVDYNKGFVEKDSVWVSEDAYNFLAKSKLFGDEIIISNVGEYAGKAFICPNLGYPMSLAPNSIMMKTSGNDRFYYYYFCSPKGYKQIRNIVTKSGQPKFNKTNFRELEVPNPPIDVQDAIVKVLKTIDDKIDNNNAICSNLEAMAKLLYDYWFVQFDFPDENGKPYKSSGGKMVWNDELKREIPAGWEVKPLVEYISVIRGISYKPTDELKQSSAKSVSLLKSNNIQNGTINFEQPVFLPQQLADKNQWLTEGSVFITMSSGSKAHMGKTAIVYKDLPYVFGAFCAKIVIDNSVRGYLSTYFRSEWFRAYIENVTAGTSINNIGNDQLTNILLPFPDNDIQKRFEDYLKPMFFRYGELGTETQQLASLRDFLLPMLMNGQVKVGA